jgi:hypothetical protein
MAAIFIGFLNNLLYLLSNKEPHVQWKKHLKHVVYELFNLKL